MPWPTSRGQRAGARPRRGAERRHRHSAGRGRRAGARRARAVLTSPTTVRAETRRRGARRSRPTSCSSPPAPRPRVMATAPPRRRAHPHLAADLRPRRPARAPGRRRLGRHRRRAGAGLPRARLARSCWSPRATACCPARTPTPPRSSRTSSPSAAWRCSGARGWRPSSAPPTASCAPRGRPRGRRRRTPCWRSAPCRTPRGIGLEDAGVALTASGHVEVDRVSRTSVRGVYAAGDCTGVLPLASVAAMQGRIAMSHALGDAVAPLNLRVVSANIFTDPEIATVGVSQKDVDDEVGRRRGRSCCRCRATRAPRCWASATAS